jgi:hypothetical protein
MMPNLPRLILAVLGAGLLLAGCAGHRPRPGANETRNPPRRAAAEAPPAPATQPAESHPSRASHAAAGNAPETAPRLPDSTGIPACDDYLASYVACHRAAAIYKPEQIQGRYEAMRTSLLRDSQDPAIRPNLAARCNSLASQLRQALHGRACDSAPAAPGSQAGG